MGKKFIPNGDGDFAEMATKFANAVGGEPSRFGVSDVDSAELREAVRRFREALENARRHGTKSPAATAAKEKARGDAERIVRRLAGVMRVNPSLDATAKIEVGLRERSARPTARSVPNEAPWLHFERAIHAGGCVPEHELVFKAQDLKPRPPGAVRLELFVDLVPPDVNVREYYASEGRTRPVYVRSYTRSPIRLVPPMATTPMRVVYVARWADAAGDVGPFCEPVAAWVEGGTHHLMSFGLPGRQTPVTIVDVSDAAVARETTVVVAMLAGHAARRTHAPRLERETVRRIAGPAETEAA